MKVKNGYANPNSLKWRYVQYRAEFQYPKPADLPWLERIHFKFYPIDFELDFDIDSTKYVSTDSYVDFPLNLYYLGDERDSFHMTLRPTTKEGWRVELWDTAYIDTIDWHIKLDAVQPQGDDSSFIARIHAPTDAAHNDTNVTILYTKTKQ